MYQILKGGCDTRHCGSFLMQRPEGLPNYILLIIKSHCAFHIAGRHEHVTPGHAIIISPGTPYSYNSTGDAYTDDYLHFSVEDPYLFDRLYPMTNVLFPVKNTEMLTSFIRQILWEQSYAPASYRGENIDALSTVLFHHLMVSYETREKTNTSCAYSKQLQALRLQLQSSPGAPHTIREHAREMGVCESYFQHLYRDFFGISFQKDLIRLRIEYAKYILTTTDLTLEQVAELCGYTNEIHFYRQFKQLSGMTPSKYRKQR